MKAASIARQSVLVVDDERIVRDLLEQALARRGVQVTKASDLDEARLELEQKQFELVLTDLNLASGREGLTVARLARTRNPQARVVLFSGYGLDDVADEAVRLGVDELLAKPFPLSALDRLLEALVAEQPTANRPPAAPSTRISDRQGQALLERFIAGESEAIERIADAYRPMLYAVFMRWFRLSQEDAEDLYQEVLLQLLRKATTIRTLRMWLLGTAINQAKKRIRCLIRDRRLAERYLEDMELRAPDEDEDVRELVLRGLERLRPRDRQLLALIYIHGLSYQEVATRLERPIGSIGPLRGRALKRLTETIGDLERPAQELIN